MSSSDIAARLPEIFAVTVFVLTYGVIAVGRFPGLRLDRAGAALVGASLMVAGGVMTLPEAYRAIDFDTLTLLLGMMIIRSAIEVIGFKFFEKHFFIQSAFI